MQLETTSAQTAEFRTLLLASFGTALEFYDFIIFVFFAGVIGRVFFSTGLPDWVRQLQTSGIFAAGYFARPLGGIAIVHFGDTSRRWFWKVSPLVDRVGYWLCVMMWLSE